MPFSSLPRRIFLSTSSWPSYRWLRSIRFATTVSNSSAFKERVNGATVKVLDPSQPESLQSPTEHGTDAAGRASDSSKTESFLLSLLTDGDTPTLRDLEQLKPSGHSDPRSTEYALEYRTLLDNICRSFSSDQLRCFAQEYGLQLSPKRRKMVFAETIVEKAWQWPSLRELKRVRRDRTEVLSQTIPLSSSELFVLLGKDGSDLSQLSRMYNVHVSVKPNPLAIYLEGSRMSVREAEAYVEGVKKDIVEDTIDTPFEQPASQEILQKISRLSGAFVENIGNQKLRVRAKHPTNIVLAQRLSVRLQHQREPSELLVQRIQTQGLATPTTAPLAYALYPFTIPRSLPLMMGSNTFFRWRRVGDWLEYANSESPGVNGLATPQSNIFSVDGTEVNLQHQLTMDPSLPSHSSRRLISASSGHILFPSPRRSSLLASPTVGSTYSETRSWISIERSSATFIPSLPLALVKVLPSQQKVLHRLVYRSLPVLGHDIKGPIATHFIRLEVPLIDLKQVRSPVDLPGGNVFADAMFWSGRFANLDILMPDRRMDLRFNISDMNALASNQCPGELLKYLNELENFLVSSDSGVVQPVPPLRVLHDNREYVLATNASVRQSTESLSSDPSPEIAVTSESTLDLESGHHSAVCVISSDRLDSPRKLNAFLQKCDQMTARTRLRNSELL